ncbi:hypothetical protein UCDDA912_g00581 [Diaporthe ampelina]|uniref:DUF7582 domain-containing protein n=1 Tax=Diaporthe ampelina TaxID=1214573 RepID=A0A0G2IG45_9PEZI|nr:hypothetical protein UCDDA912_g00581 [Diaporthe ampelina]
MAFKGLISSPLEAGTSILDAHHLPSSFNPVFEYTSKRLARKGLHITLTVARKEHHVSTQTMGDKNEATASNDPMVIMTPPQTPDVVPRTPGFSTFKSLHAGNPQDTWDSQNACHAHDTRDPSLHYDGFLDNGDHRVVKTTLDRAVCKFHLSTPLVAHDPSAHGIPPDVIHRSILQNEILFSSEGLTVLSLDHLYTFKSALAHYAASMYNPGSDFRLEDAVDELRRYVLSSSGGRRRLLKSALLRSYEWLGPVSDAALDGVMKMYCRAYGGASKDTGIEDDLAVTPMPGAKSQKRTPAGAGPPPTRCSEEDGDIKIELAADDDEGGITDFEDGDLTARPPPTATSVSFWVGGSIDEMLSSRQQQQRESFDSFRPRHHRRSSSWGQSSQRLGPVTPNGADDLSPITRGEWGFLMVSDPFRTRTAAVETC